MASTDQNILLSHDDQTHPRTPKRQKIEIACDVCKLRKSKCDGARPECGPCRRRKGGRDAHLCKYRSIRSDGVQASQRISSRTTTRYGPKSQPRLSVTRKILTRRPERAALIHSDVEQGTTNAQVNAMSMLNDPANQTEVVREASYVPSDGSACDRDVDAMGCVDGWALRSGLLGTSSAASFTHQVRNAAHGTQSPVLGAKGSRSDHVTTRLLRLHRQREADVEVDDAQLVLPQKKTADHLFETYWRHSDCIFPWLEEEEIRRQYASLWVADDVCDIDQKVFYCTLNFMFAIAARLDPQSQSKFGEKSAKTYYERARDLMSFNLVDISHFEILQVLLLATQYLQSTNMPRQCFQMLGLAIWVAQDLGLHLPETTSLLRRQSEQDLARRVWHGCIMMDRVAAMTFGRPTRISKAMADKAIYPRPDGGSASSGATVSPHAKHPPRYQFFISYCKLHYILGDILEILYTEEDDGKVGDSNKPNIHPATQKFGQLIQIDHTLSDWHNNLSNHFKDLPASVDTPEHQRTSRQANILHARYCFLRLMLFRPFFTQSQQQHQTVEAESSSLEAWATRAIVTECQSRCVEAAQSIIDLIHRNLFQVPQNSQDAVLPSQWFTVSYIFSSSLVLLAALLVPSSPENVLAPHLEFSLDRTYDILRYYEAHTKSAHRCRAVLESLHGNVKSSRKPGQNPTQQLSTIFQESARHIKKPYLSSRSQSTDIDLTNFVPTVEDFSWLDTDFIFWQDESFSLSSLDSTVLDG